MRLSWQSDEVQKAQQQAAQLQVGCPCPSRPVRRSMPVSVATLPRVVQALKLHTLTLAPQCGLRAATAALLRPAGAVCRAVSLACHAARHCVSARHGSTCPNSPCWLQSALVTEEAQHKADTETATKAAEESAALVADLKVRSVRLALNTAQCGAPCSNSLPLEGPPLSCSAECLLLC